MHRIPPETWQRRIPFANTVKDLGLWSSVKSEIPFEMRFFKLCVLLDNAARKGNMIN